MSSCLRPHRSLRKKSRNLQQPRTTLLRSALVFNLALLLIVLPPLQSSIYAQNKLAQFEEAAFSIKADTLLKSVRRAASADRAARRSGSLTGAVSEINELSGVAGVEQQADGSVQVSLAVDLTDESAWQLRAAGFAVGARVGDVATVETEIERLPELAALGSIESLQLATYYYPTNEQARHSIKVDNTAGQRLVAQTGRNVVVGIIDSGIDFRHLVFTLPGTDGKRTRLKALLDMTVYSSGGTAPDPNWNYVLPGASAPIGRLYTEADINNALDGTGTIEQKDLSGHGTHVAGTAAGNGLAGPAPGAAHAGMAPEADLVIVKANRQNTSTASFRTTDVINAMRFVEHQAAELSKPFVINLSLGGHNGPHDGTGPDEKAIDEIVERRTGRAVCVAAGNEGSRDIHASGRIAAGEEIELKIDARNLAASGAPAISPRFLDLYYSEADRFTITVIKPDNAPDKPSQVGPVAYNSSNTADAIVDVYNITDAQNGQHRIRVDFTDNARNLGSDWTIKLQGTTINADGRFQAWIYDGNFTSFVDPSGRVGSPGTARGAITVGAYVTRSTAQTAGEAAVFTSQGPTADGREKPDISAPGRYLYSAKSATSNYGSNPLNFVGNTYAASSGTSMATPVVAGAVALLLEANPGLSTDQVKDLIKNTAAHDSFTTASGWNDRLGFGKLDVNSAIAALSVSISLATLPLITNRIDDVDFFVRQHYSDFLSREPEAAGLNDWKRVLERCGSDRTCLARERIEVSAAFFRSEEFQLKGFFVYRFYKATLGRLPKYAEIIPDMQRVSGATNDEVTAKRDAFTAEWMNRAEFKAKYDNTSNSVFVDRLAQSAGGVASATRNTMVADLERGSRTRTQIVRAVVESSDVVAREYNPAFVAMQYFGYLRRDTDVDGYNAWLRVINGNPADYKTMVNGFLNSSEYRRRF